MVRRHRVVIVVAVTAVVFAWSTVMVAIGQTAAIFALAPVLGLTVQQIVLAVRAQAAPASGHRVAGVPDKPEDSAP
ncbi:hypothetical protein DKG34_40820 [Streptomyces sp. NWU49]|uniref:hypothetical protein n=1 Tax=Streptomyces sp. NWU49 TaxID=2201153 RepID=UPI000D68399A|nr:hypothetical protein [Streptomyces sp. NWU49]PWJ02051.1 hypothetical protein DKG34_40820 [Streptomyces sp. NWU49]